MRKTLPLIAGLSLTAALLLPSISHANGPSLVEPTYDLAAKSLSVKIRHRSLVDSLHYIKYVEIKVNGTLPLTNKYDKQPGSEYTYTYNVAASPGDVIEVTAKCNLWGSRTVGLTIPRPDDALKTEPTTKPDE
jgi:hypothetical protein